jgi:hypothetical protein
MIKYGTTDFLSAHRRPFAPRRGGRRLAPLNGSQSSWIGPSIDSKMLLAGAKPANRSIRGLSVWRTSRRDGWLRPTCSSKVRSAGWFVSSCSSGIELQGWARPRNERRGGGSLESVSSRCPSRFSRWPSSMGTTRPATSAGPGRRRRCSRSARPCSSSRAAGYSPSSSTPRWRPLTSASIHSSRAHPCASSCSCLWSRQLSSLALAAACSGLLLACRRSGSSSTRPPSNSESPTTWGTCSAP